jgi:hypothetical protein
MTWAALVYVGLFAGVVILGHLPHVNDSQGRLFGLFHITIYQDLLHGASGLWALLAVLHSDKQVKIYMQWFGTIYFLDGVLGAITGVTFLDAGVFIGKEPINPMSTRILANVPHILIGGGAVLIGFVFAKRWMRADPAAA